MKEEPSDDLLVIMSMRVDNPREAELAFNEFYQRYRRYIWGAVCNMANSLKILGNHKTGKEDVLKDTFLAAFQNAEKFTPKPEIDIEMQIRWWLVGILKIQIKRWMAEATKNRMHFKYIEELPCELFDNLQDREIVEPVESIPQQRLRQAMETTLSEKEREILLSWYVFEEVDSKSKKIIPAELKETFCAIHGLKPDSIRQIKGRALKKLKSAFNIGKTIPLSGKQGV